MEVFRVVLATETNPWKTRYHQQSIYVTVNINKTLPWREILQWYHSNLDTFGTEKVSWLVRCPVELYTNTVFGTAKSVMFIYWGFSPASSPSKGGGTSPCIRLHPLYWWGGAVAAPQTGLTSCQIGGIGYPRTVRGNPRHIPFRETWLERFHCTNSHKQWLLECHSLIENQIFLWLWVSPPLVLVGA